MWPPVVPILTILTFLGSVASVQSRPPAVLADKALIEARQGPASHSPAAVPPNTRAASTSSTTISKTSTSTSSTSTTTSSTRSTSTVDPSTTTSLSDTFTTQPSSSSGESSSSTNSHTTTARSSISDVTIIPTSPSSFTSKSTTGSGGASFTVTAVVSRPTGTTTNDGASASSRTGFFANKGAVAGTFLIVGLLGTAFLLCAFLSVLRKCRRRKHDQAYYPDEYKEFNRDRNGTTPEPTLPAMHDPRSTTPVAPSPEPNMIERLHGTDQSPQNMDFNRVQGQYQRESGEFNPYKVQEATYGYPGGQANYAQYAQYVHQGQQQSGANVHESQLGAHATPMLYQTVAGPPHHSQQQLLDPLYEVGPSLRGSQGH